MREEKHSVKGYRCPRGEKMINNFNDTLVFARPRRDIPYFFP